MIPSATLGVTRLRGQLWACGYRPVAVYSHDAAVPNAGKAPWGHGWQNRARRDPPGAVTEPAIPNALNTGILCDEQRALDLDIDDTATAAIARDLAQRFFGCTLMRTRHNSPRTLLLYRAAKGAPVKRTLKGQFGKIEVLGFGQQFVAYGTHPSGVALLWRPTGPATVHRAMLPAVSESAITEFFDAVSPVIGAAKPPEPEAQNIRRPANVAALAGLVRTVAAARNGERNSVAFWGACRAGEMVAAGQLAIDTAIAIIAEAATRSGLSPSEAVRTAASGVRTGLGANQHA